MDELSLKTLAKIITINQYYLDVYFHYLYFRNSTKNQTNAIYSKFPDIYSLHQTFLCKLAVLWEEVLF